MDKIYMSSFIFSNYLSSLIFTHALYMLSSILSSTIVNLFLFTFVSNSILGTHKRCLSRSTTDEKLEEAFSPFGQLVEARVITDKASGRSKGFGFVKYSTIEEAEKAKEKMNAQYLDGWVIFVDPAKPREPRPPPPPAQQQDFGVKTIKTIGWCG
ncbi:hypothetical protein ACHQM5_009769 [Ranunculus cassubicifolius]